MRLTPCERCGRTRTCQLGRGEGLTRLAAAGIAWCICGAAKLVTAETRNQERERVDRELALRQRWGQ